MPNHSILEGVAKSIAPSPDGHGAEVAFQVTSAGAAPGEVDFIGAKSGATLRLYAAAPEAIEQGGRYRVRASVLGGPDGERIVIEAAEPIA